MSKKIAQNGDIVCYFETGKQCWKCSNPASSQTEKYQISHPSCSTCLIPDGYICIACYLKLS